MLIKEVWMGLLKVLLNHVFSKEAELFGADTPFLGMLRQIVDIVDVQKLLPYCHLLFIYEIV